MHLWLEFIFAASVIIYCGIQLSKYGDVIAEKTGLGRAWIGLVMMASITSLPELMTGISSVAIAGLPDIAVGNILGACAFNLLILALLDPMEKGSPIFSKVGRSNILSASFSILMMSLAAASMLLGENVPSFMSIGVYTPFFIMAYLAGIRVVYYYEKKAIKEFIEEAAVKFQYAHIPLKRAVLAYSINALAVIVVATWLPFLADDIAEATGLGDRLVGTIFVSVATTLPELVVSISSIRIGAYDLAIGNLFGSNMFNLALLAIDDIFYRNGPLLQEVSPMHALTALAGVLMSSIAVISMAYRQERKHFVVFGWDSLTMLCLWILNTYILFAIR